MVAQALGGEQSLTEPGDWEVIQDLYAEGLALDRRGRLELLKRRCPERPDLHAEVNLLWEHGEAEDSAVDFDGIRDLSLHLMSTPQSEVEKPPNGLDRYQILEPLGRGGMGVVYKAEQCFPIQRPVALKVLPLGSCSNERLQRFQAEQRALSLIQHPNVAAVYDHGKTPEGQPFYTMELLESQPITEYCDGHRLTIEARLRLFIQVCEGLAQAHRKGIIHRDINPANVLVTETEKGPIPKIIDFGIAKFKDPADLQQPIQTVRGLIMGTPGYMSPEQAAGAGEESIDTLCDIYALGALLYELVAGITPLGDATHSAGSLHELYQVTRTHIPSRPSAHLTTDNDACRKTAEARGTTPLQLKKKVRGELEWIIMKAIAFEPTARYPNCEDLARDIGRYLEGLPLEAGPISRFYRLRKLVSYHRKAVLLSAAFLTMLLAGTVIISAALVRALRAEAATQTALDRLSAVNDFTLGIFGGVHPSGSGREVTGYELLELADQKLSSQQTERPELEAWMRNVLGFSYSGLGLLEESRRQYQRSLELHQSQYGAEAPETLEAKIRLAYVETSLGHLHQARGLYQACLEGFGRQYGAEDALTLTAASGLALVLAGLGENQEALSLFRQTLERQERLLGPHDERTASTRHNLINLLLNMRNGPEAERLLQQSLPWIHALENPDHPLAIRTLRNQAKLLEVKGLLPDAELIYRDVLKRCRRVLGERHPDTLNTLNSLAIVMGEQGEPAEAVTLIEQTLQQVPPDLSSHPVLPQLRHNLGNYLLAMGEYERATRELTRVLEDRTKIFGEHHEKTLITRWTLVEIQAATGPPGEALSQFRSVLAMAEENLGPNHPTTQLLRQELTKY